MEIVRLALTGFKSFPDKTTFEFGQGISCVVGPNGSGKSNVVDALRWCIGEQSVRSLRGAEMTDVIFNGSEGRSPRGFAEVSLTMRSPNGEEFPGEYAGREEVEVGRRLHRTGTSEYLINKEKVRRRDVLDLFMDTGIGANLYSFIEQGQVDKLIYASPLDRRSVIDEAAGIGRYKARRRESMQRLDATCAQLDRAADVADEMARRLSMLAKAVWKAARFRALRARVRQAEIDLGLVRYKELTSDRRALQETERGQSAKVEQVAVQQGHLEKDHAERKQELAVFEEAVSRARDELAEIDARLRESEGATRLHGARHHELSGLLKHTEAQLVENARRLETLRAECEEGEGDLARARETLEGTTEQRAAVAARLDAALHAQEEVSQQLTGARAARTEAREGWARRKQELTEIQTRRVALAPEQARWQSVADAATEEVEACAKEIVAFAEELERLDPSRLEEAQGIRADAPEWLAEARSELERAREVRAEDEERFEEATQRWVGGRAGYEVRAREWVAVQEQQAVERSRAWVQALDAQHTLDRQRHEREVSEGRSALQAAQRTAIQTCQAEGQRAAGEARAAAEAQHATLLTAAQARVQGAVSALAEAEAHRDGLQVTAEALRVAVAEEEARVGALLEQRGVPEELESRLSALPSVMEQVTPPDGSRHLLGRHAGLPVVDRATLLELLSGCPEDVEFDLILARGEGLSSQLLETPQIADGVEAAIDLFIEQGGPVMERHSGLRIHADGWVQVGASEARLASARALQEELASRRDRMQQSQVELVQVDASLEEAGAQRLARRDALDAARQDLDRVIEEGTARVEQAVAQAREAHESAVRALLADHEQARAQVEQDHERARANLLEGQREQSAAATQASERALAKVREAALLTASEQASEEERAARDALTSAEEARHVAVSALKQAEEALEVAAQAERLWAVANAEREVAQRGHDDCEARRERGLQRKTAAQGEVARLAEEGAGLAQREDEVAASLKGGSERVEELEQALLDVLESYTKSEATVESCRRDLVGCDVQMARDTERVASADRAQRAREAAVKLSESDQERLTGLQEEQAAGAVSAQDASKDAETQAEGLKAQRGESWDRLETQRALTRERREALEAQSNALREVADLRRESGEALSVTRSHLERVQTELGVLAEGVEEKYQLSLAGELDRLEARGEIELGVPEEVTVAVEIRGRTVEPVFPRVVKRARLLDQERVTGVAKQLEEDRASLGRMGEVNLAALEEHTDLAKRHRELVVQREDLDASVRDLRAAIAKMNRTCRRKFRDAFDAVNERFQKAYPRLVGGGEAYLGLTDEEDLLETGVEIFVQPPGKRLQTLTLLSGGEKAMAAIALLVALFQVKPSPFCVLDEVDAPLDESNGARFNEMLREMSEVSQLLVVTHNRKTMECADKLVGVTMAKPGISKVVQVNL